MEQGGVVLFCHIVIYDLSDTKNNIRRFHMTKFEKILVALWGITILYLVVQITLYMSEIATSLGKIAEKLG